MIAQDMSENVCYSTRKALGLSMSAATLALVRQAVRSQSMTFTMRDANGFTPAEAAELKRRIADVERGNAKRRF